MRKMQCWVFHSVSLLVGPVVNCNLATATAPTEAIDGVTTADLRARRSKQLLKAGVTGAALGGDGAPAPRLGWLTASMRRWRGWSKRGHPPEGKSVESARASSAMAAAAES
jgi:hypothetical protein